MALEIRSSLREKPVELGRLRVFRRSEITRGGGLRYLELNLERGRATTPRTQIKTSKIDSSTKMGLIEATLDDIAEAF